jgi:hypothetical protein
MEADDRMVPKALPDGDGGVEDAERAFMAGLIARGEAARPDEHGNLPPGATHELVEDEAGRTVARRRRFA